MCTPCALAERRIGPLPQLVPITMSRHQSHVHSLLRGYKDGPTDEERERKTRPLAALVSSFFENHRTCLGAFDLISTVPSHERDAPAAIVSRVASLQRDYRQLLRLRRPLGHRDYDAEAFEVDPSVRSQRVLLIDDTFTTGSAVFSAAAAVRAANGAVASCVVIGRHVSDWPTNRPVMDWLQQLPWRDDECCVCNGAHPPGRLPI